MLLEKKTHLSYVCSEFLICSMYVKGWEPLAFFKKGMILREKILFGDFTYIHLLYQDTLLCAV